MHSSRVRQRNHALSAARRRRKRLRQLRANRTKTVLAFRAFPVNASGAKERRHFPTALLLSEAPEHSRDIDDVLWVARMDTGARVNIMCESRARELKGVRIRPVKNTRLYGLGTIPVRVIGIVNVRFKQRTGCEKWHTEDFYVLKDEDMGRIDSFLCEDFLIRHRFMELGSGYSK